MSIFVWFVAYLIGALVLWLFDAPSWAVVMGAWILANQAEMKCKLEELK